MQATVTAITGEGRIYVKVRRAYYQEQLQRKHAGEHGDLKVGDKVEVRRQSNNPYLVRVVA